MKRLVILSAFACLLLASSVKADTIVITGGTANILGPATGPSVGSFNLLAAGFSASGSGDRNSASGLTNIHGSSTFIGSVTQNGTGLGGVFNDATILNFVLAPFTPPDPSGGASIAFVSTAFTMTGNLTLVAPGQIVLFSSLVSGSGFAGITYALIDGRYIPTNVSYVFGATAPLPEPATVILLGTGLAGAAGALRRRRKARA